MTLSYNNCLIGKVSFTTKENLNEEQVKEHALKQLYKNYHNCTIGEVYVNGKLVYKNIKV